MTSKRETKMQRRKSNFAMVLAGPAALEAWRRDHPGDLLDCSGLDITGIQNPNFNGVDLSGIDFSHSNLKSANLHGANLKGSKLIRTDLRNATLVSADLGGADLTDADFTEANLNQASLIAANTTRTEFSRANLSRATFGDDVNLSNGKFAGADLTQCVFHEANFSDASLARATLHNTTFRNARFDNADMNEAKFQNGTFRGASFTNTNLTGATLTLGNFEGASFYNASLLEAEVDLANFNQVRGLEYCRQLETVKIITRGNSPKYLDNIVVRWLDRWTSWEMLRVFGKLPLFGVSYSAIVAMPFFFYLLELFNSKIDATRSTAIEFSKHYTVFKPVAQAILRHLHREPVPALSIYLYGGTIVLAIAATIYALGCPARIKEFSKEQWRDQLGHSLIHYFPFSWKHRWLRIICAPLYLIGAGLVLFVLLSKIWNTFFFLAANAWHS